MARRTVIIAVAILLAGLTITPAALATSARVRVEAATHTIAPWTSVAVAASGTLTDSAGNAYPVDHASALGALAVTADRRGFTFLTGFGGDYVAEIAGLPSWMYAVNGAGWPNIDVGAFTFRLAQSDRVVFYQSLVFTPDTQLLAVRASRVGLKPGQNLTLRAVGDLLSKPNSAADAERFHVDPGTAQAPAEFPATPGVTFHIGSRSFLDGAVAPDPYANPEDGRFDIADLPIGRYAVWAEKTTDAAFTYVRSVPFTVDVNYAPVISALSAKPRIFTPGRERVTISFSLSKRATIHLDVRNNAGKIVYYATTKAFAAGRHAFTWSGRNTNGNLVRAGRYSLRLTATDRWGRHGTAAVTVRAVR